MASPSRTSAREEERRLNLRTLVIASAAAASAALITSRLWIAGTWIAAAMTPVIVTLVSELLNRPTERIAKSLTSDRPVLEPDLEAPAPPPGRSPREPSPPPRRDRDVLPDPGAPAPVRVYRAGSSTPRSANGSTTRTGGRSGARPRRRKIAFGVVFGTAALAFVIAVLALTVPELVAGGSVGKNDGRTTLFGGSKKDSGDRESPAPQDTTPEEQEPRDESEQPTTPEDEQPTTPEDETTTTPAPTEPEAAPPPAGEPLSTETAPAPTEP